MAEVPALPRDTPLLILNGFTNYSMPEFFDPFELILKTERIIQFENDGYRHDDRKCLKRVKKLTMLASNSFHYLKFPIIGTFHITTGTAWPKENSHVIIVAENTTLQIAPILVTRPNLISPRRSAQLVGVVVNTVVDASLDVVADAKVTARSG